MQSHIHTYNLCETLGQIVLYTERVLEGNGISVTHNHSDSAPRLKW